MIAYHGGSWFTLASPADAVFRPAAWEPLAFVSIPNFRAPPAALVGASSPCTWAATAVCVLEPPVVSTVFAPRPTMKRSLRSGPGEFAVPLHSAQSEIGRASCRERV